MDRQQIPFGILFVVLTGIFVWFASRKPSNFVVRFCWGIVAVFCGLSGAPSFIPTTSENNIRIDLVVTNFFLAPLFAILAVVGFGCIGILRILKPSDSVSSKRPSDAP